MHSPGDRTDLWIERTRAKAAPRLRLFCFPYAGGSAGIFRDWASELGSGVEVCAIRLPGREWRYAEPAFRRSEQAVEALVPILRGFLDLPFAMFGHSMGAALAYETARAILSAAAVEPRVLFVSGRGGPQVRSRTRDLHALPRDELIAELKAFNGTPAEVFDHEDLVELVLPMLRSDLELAETYASGPGPMLSCPVVALGGTGDPGVAPPDLAAWRTVTAGPFRSMVFAGDHFFINGARTSVLQAMRREITALGLA